MREVIMPVAVPECATHVYVHVQSRQSLQPLGWEKVIAHKGVTLWKKDVTALYKTKWPVLSEM